MRTKNMIVLLLTLASATGCSAAKTQQVGPPNQIALPNQLAPIWSAAIEPDQGLAHVSLFAVTASSVIVPTPGGDLAILDAMTGRPERSIAPDTGWNFTSTAVIGERLYAYLKTTTDDPTIARLEAYDLSTGRSLWRTDIKAQPDRIFLSEPMITSRGIVVVQSSEVEPGPTDLVQGLRLADGKATWLGLRLPCSTGSDIGTASAAVFLLECTNGIRLVTIDPADAQVSWQHVLVANPSAYFAFNPPELSLSATNLGDIIAQTGHTASIFTPSGRLIVTRAPPSSCWTYGCDVVAAGQIGILNFDTETGPVEQAFNLSTGQVVWQQPGELIIGPGTNYLMSASSQDYGGILFARAGPSIVDEFSSLLPAFVLAMQVSTGRSTVLPLPLVGNSTSANTVFVGSTAHLLIVAEEAAENAYVMALRPENAAIRGPAVLGGVTAAEWPNACTLLTPADLRFIAAGYASAPRPVTLSGANWPKPVTCAYVGPNAGDPAVTLTIAWFASSNEQANELLRSKLSVYPVGTCGRPCVTSPPPSQRIPGGYLVDDGTIEAGVDQALIVAGRAIVTVTVPGHPDDARKLAPLIAARLRTSTGS
jgi:outer membrane protein assembly factor BamB